MVEAASAFSCEPMGGRYRRLCAVRSDQGLAETAPTDLKLSAVSDRPGLWNTEPGRDARLHGFGDEKDNEADHHLDDSESFMRPAEVWPELEDRCPDSHCKGNRKEKFCSQNVAPHRSHYSSPMSRRR